MSIVTCDHCDRYIDSDGDSCFIDNPMNTRKTNILCESCRDHAAERWMEAAAGDGPMTLQEEYQAAYKLKKGCL